MKKTNQFIFLLVAPLTVSAVESTTRDMSFDQCIDLIQRTATQLSSAPLNVVETTEVRIVRFLTDDGSGGSVLVTCSRPDHKMVMTISK